MKTRLEQVNDAIRTLGKELHEHYPSLKYSEIEYYRTRLKELGLLRSRLQRMVNDNPETYT